MKTPPKDDEKTPPKDDGKKSDRETGGRLPKVDEPLVKRGKPGSVDEGKYIILVHLRYIYQHTSQRPNE